MVTASCTQFLLVVSLEHNCLDYLKAFEPLGYFQPHLLQV